MTSKLAAFSAGLCFVPWEYCYWNAQCKKSNMHASMCLDKMCLNAMLLTLSSAVCWCCLSSKIKTCISSSLKVSVMQICIVIVRDNHLSSTKSLHEKSKKQARIKRKLVFFSPSKFYRNCLLYHRVWLNVFGLPFNLEPTQLVSLCIILQINYIYCF